MSYATRAGEPNTQGPWNRMTPTDLIALIVIIGGLALMALGINGLVGGLVVSVVAYYFGKRGRISTDDLK